jgi:glutamate-1-semialdehyde 2,1-aminomutase
MKPSTNSKEHLPIIAKAKGKYVWDINGKKYLDFSGANLTNILGYRPRKSVVPNFSGVSIAEAELSGLLSKYTGFDYFRYYANGSDAVNNAVRLARHILGDDNASVLFFGYAGSNDSYARTINDSGIPEQDSEQVMQGACYTSADILVFESRHKKIAKDIKAKIKIEDCLKSGVLALYEQHNSDLVCYGKSIFNGSAGAILTGKNEYMKRIDEVYYSTTFGSNNDMMAEGIRTIKGFEKVKEKYFELYDYAKKVLPPWQSLKPEQIKEFLKHGIIYNGYWQVLAVHTKKDIDRLAMLCNKVL